MVEEGEKIFIQVCPDISELSVVRTNVNCTEEGCEAVFANTSSLEMHLIKTHKKESCYLDKLATNVDFQYFCPVASCKYAFSPLLNHSHLRWFTKMKHLKQHYINMHKEKNLQCPSCAKVFALEKRFQRHVRVECGVIFKCLTCKASYQTYAALYTHCKKKLHSFETLQSPKKKCLKGTLQQGPVRVPCKEYPILPNPYPESVVNLAATALSELSWKVVVKGVEKGVQTDGRRRAPFKSVNKKRDSRQTQTGDKTTRISAQTQTTALYSTKKASRSRRKGKNTETQTSQNKSNFLLSGELSPKNEYPLKDVVLPQFWSSRNSSSTQTAHSDPVQVIFDGSKKDLNLDLFCDFRREEEPVCSTSQEMFSNAQIDELIQQGNIFDDTRSCNIETQTEFDFSGSFIDTCPLFSNTETQTIQEAIDEYSNTYTQTCDDVFLNDFVEFSDIETQTAWVNLTLNSSLVSAETQTLL